MTLSYPFLLINSGHNSSSSSNSSSNRSRANNKNNGMTYLFKVILKQQRISVVFSLSGLFGYFMREQMAWVRMTTNNYK